jgi:Uma2 family endonuclease
MDALEKLDVDALNDQTIALKIPNLTTDGFKELCEVNENLRLERASTGEILIMPPTYPWTGRKNSGIIAQLWNWNDQNELGIVFDSSTGFTLLNGAVYSPDASWVDNQKWDTLTQTQQEQEFSPIAPDFVVELRSSSDSLTKLREKMKEYIENGVRLGWLIDAKNKTVYIYRPGSDIEVLESPTILSGEDVLPGFELNLNKIW